MKPDRKSNFACAFAAGDAMIAAIDRAAGAELLSRSAWTRRAVARELERNGFLPAEKPASADRQEGATA